MIANWADDFRPFGKLAYTTQNWPAVNKQTNTERNCVGSAAKYRTIVCDVQQCAISHTHTSIMHTNTYIHSAHCRFVHVCVCVLCTKCLFIPELASIDTRPMQSNLSLCCDVFRNILYIYLYIYKLYTNAFEAYGYAFATIFLVFVFFSCGSHGRHRYCMRHDCSNGRRAACMLMCAMCHSFVYAI